MANPNPARITDELWRFRTECLAIEPGSADQDSGIYADKPGYHNTRAQNDPANYSVRDAPDKVGPADKAAAWDWTFTTAQSGDYSRIAIYGKRMRAAWDAEDQRCNVLREFLGQTDTDTTPEGLDFRYHTTRTPDDSHSWHDHFSFVRAYVAVAGALEGVLSVLRGETLDAYLARGGKLYRIDGTGEIEEPDMEQKDHLIHPIAGAPNRDVGNVFSDLSGFRDWEVSEETTALGTGAPGPNSRAALLHARMAETAATVAKIPTNPTMSPEQAQTLIDAVDKNSALLVELIEVVKAGTGAAGDYAIVAGNLTMRRQDT